MRTHNAVTSKITHAVHDVVLVRPYYALVHQVPEESAGTAGIRHHQPPIILQSGTMTAVVKTVQELRRHEDFLLPHIFSRLAPRAVMLGLETVAVGPRIEHHALLRVELPEIGFQFVVETALVAVAPEDNRRMVHIARYHLLHEFCPVDGLVGPVPARQFTFHIEAK